MEKYDYRNAVLEDVREAIKSNDMFRPESGESMEDFIERVYDDLWVDDGVTGNGSGSYTFNTWQAEENLCHILDLLKEAIADFGGEANILDDAEGCDVTIRYYLLGEAVSEVVGDLWEGWQEQMEDEEDDEDNE